MTLQTVFYRAGLARLHPDGWESRVDDGVLLVAHGAGWTFDADQTSLDAMGLDLTELVADGYTRMPLVPSSPSWSAGVWSLPSGAVLWPDLGTDEAIAAVVGFELGVDDTSSVPLWAVLDDGGAPIATCDGTDMTFTVTLEVG